METPSTDSDVWGPFLESHWMKSPGSVSGVVGEAFVTEDDIFTAALEAARENRGARGDKWMKLFVRNGNLVSNLKNFVPVVEDGSWERYEERLRRDHGIHEFGLQIDNIHLRNPDILAKVIPLFEHVWRHRGISMMGVYVDAFIGNYARTPFGVHRDPLHDFMFMIKGQRRIRLWSPETGEACGIEERDLDYDPHLEEGLVLEGRPENILYWPPSYWHVGESAGLSISMNVNFLSETRVGEGWSGIEPLLHAIRQQRRCKLLRPSPPFVHFDAIQASGELAVPKSLCEAIDGVREACASGGFARAVVAQWLAHVSRFGFLPGHTRPTEVPRRRLSETGTVRAVPGFPFYWVRHAGRILWACWGRCGELPDAEAGAHLLRRLMNGQPAQVANLLGERPSQSGTEVVKSFLEELVNLGALEYTVRSGLE
jgi:50S ribosomal protein L16 3-hydroxylase